MSCHIHLPSILQLKHEADAESGKKSKLADYFPLYLENKFGKEKIIESAYNLWYEYDREGQS